MSTKISINASTTAVGGEDGVERPSPGKAPTAFRLFRAGENATSKGLHLFTRRSAGLILDENARRGTLYSIDVDHASLDPAAPPENHRAVGRHHLEVRESSSGPELWATAVDWSADAKAALESSPPGFRYFSPAYDVLRETGEIVGYCNVALTNNPATYGIQQIAASRGPSSTDAFVRKVLCRRDMTPELARAIAFVCCTTDDEDESDEAKQRGRLADARAAFEAANDQMAFELFVREVTDRLKGLSTNGKLSEGQRETALDALAALTRSGTKTQREAASSALREAKESLEMLRAMRVPMRGRVEASSYYEPGRFVFPLRKPSDVRANEARNEARSRAVATTVTTSRGRDEVEETRATLPREEHDEMLRAMGLNVPGEQASRTRAEGSIVFPLVKPSEARAAALRGGRR